MILTFTGCASRNTEMTSMQEQLMYSQQRELYENLIDTRAKLMFASAFLHQAPEDLARFQLYHMDLLEPSSTGCKVVEMARSDVLAGNFNILMAGDTFIPWEIEEKMWHYIAEKYKIRHFSFRFGGTEPRPFYELIEKYNTIVEMAIELKYGKSHGDMWAEAYKIANQNKSINDEEKVSDE